MEQVYEQSISINSLLTFKDYRRFRFSMFFRSIPGILLSIVLGYFLIIFLIGVPFITYESIQTGDYSFIITALVTLPMPLLLFASPFYLVYLKSKRHYESNKLLQKEYHYTFDLTGLSTSRESGCSHINWSDIFKIVETKHSFAFFTSREQAIIIPKSRLHDEEISLRSILFSCVEKKKLKIKRLV